MADNNNKNDDDEHFSNLHRRNDEIEDNSVEEMDSNPSGPDIGLGHSQRRNEGQASTSDGVRREESASFSFKHFLQSSSTGARPKVYDNPNYPNYHPKDYSRRHVNTSELASVLPDFVQDHLVVEQCYLADSTLDIEKLPDFALSGTELPLDLGQRNEQLPFDLTQLSSQPSTSRHNTSPDDFRPWNRSDRGLPLDLAQSDIGQSSSSNLPLDLAQSSNLHSLRTSRLQNENLPCDLGLGNSAQGPLDLGVGSSDSVDVPSAVSTAQSLPDFLSDGPIQIGRENEGLPVPDIPDQEEGLRRQLNEVSRRCEALESELRRCREAAHHREEALRRSNSELAALRRENLALRQTCDGQTDGRTQRVARELMAAATHAELSLRQLLSGVESLRLLASTLDQGPPPSPHSVPRHSPSTPHTDFDPEDRAGPAL